MENERVESVSNDVNANNSGVNEPTEKGGKKRHTMLMIVVIILLVGLGYLLYKRVTAKKNIDLTANPSVNVTHIRKGSINKEISVMGTILPNDTYYVPAKVGGDITKIYVKNGDYVKKGDPICEIDASKEIEAAFIQYDTAKKAYERMKKLYAAGDISLQNFESVKAQYDAAKLAYDTKVEYSVPVAVGDGVVENTNMTINTSIKVETVLCYITSEEAKEINFGVTERVLSGIKLGDKVTIEKSGEKYDGYISDIANLINTSNGLFNVKAVITSKNNFASGVMAKVTFVYDRRKNIWVLPNELIYYEGGNPYVFTVDGNSTIRKTYISVGAENEKTTEVLTGLDRNAKVVSTWNNDLADGTIVNVAKDEEVYDEIDLSDETESNTKLSEVLARKGRDVIATESEIKEEVVTTDEEVEEETAVTEKETKEEVVMVETKTNGEIETTEETETMKETVATRNEIEKETFSNVNEIGKEESNFKKNDVILDANNTNQIASSSNIEINWDIFWDTFNYYNGDIDKIGKAAIDMEVK